ncbi:hypothetical protein HW571_22980 [Agrobacterium genomosp. 3]|uniref:hypothetical protein n=1 Tax=Agrobacterium tomkonis TaxID=1183410 RepID=UPI001CD8DA1C|nr:hypothetical protein [Agrobacterium tomkonis]MCA1878813.1 hypothetical protein [Agrobacterium tumefaciens]MCA1894105.1 hypothetical protein [Agrobacterium tomkonis]
MIFKFAATIARTIGTATNTAKRRVADRDIIPAEIEFLPVENIGVNPTCLGDKLAADFAVLRIDFNASQLRGAAPVSRTLSDEIRQDANSGAKIDNATACTIERKIPGKIVRREECSCSAIYEFCALMPVAKNKLAFVLSEPILGKNCLGLCMCLALCLREFRHRPNLLFFPRSGQLLPSGRSTSSCSFDPATRRGGGGQAENQEGDHPPNGPVVIAAGDEGGGGDNNQVLHD